jgi:hypothetical protein
MRTSAIAMLLAVAAASGATPLAAQQLPKHARFELNWIEPLSSVRERAARLLTTLRAEGVLARCNALPGETPCLRSDGGQRVLRPPLPVRRPQVQPDGVPLPDDRERMYDPVFSWAPLELAADGRDSLDAWLKSASTGTPTRCDDSSCDFVVHGVAGPWSNIRTGNLVRSATGRPVDAADLQGDVIASCVVARVGSAIGPLRFCDQLAVVTEGSAWISVLAGFVPHEGRAAAMGSVEPDVRFVVRGSVSNAQRLLEEANKVLEGPFGLQTRARLGRVNGYAANRPSVLLTGNPPYREIVQISVYTDFNRGGVELDADIYLNVNPQNTDRSEDWHLASPGQVAAYSGSLRAQLHDMIARLCPAGVWRDSTTIDCR